MGARDITPSDMTAREFRDALGRYATGVTVVTTSTPLGPLGITANSFASVSLDPPLVLWSPARASRRFAAFADADHYAIHVLGAEQMDICRRFSTDGLDFAGLDWAENAQGVPLISGCLAQFECERTAVHEGGDHLIVVGRVLAFAHRPGAPLVFSGGAYGGFTGAS
ncbi:flavin reductase family protein [Ovoidimarina sediminis]|uniref:flavin reductase family protein n=1 Tax=Ovoidimarina sediminis TaxID=3079856 RepID=UPI0029133E1F|nr:flavin reductase family protein [Rhodophyticola sp. MJ-SS7]MDU8942282.1 flavin reductase family protein [Rhodophyticola sp. MJ-SS7]